MATNTLFDQLGGSPRDFGIVSNPEIEELLRQQEEDQRRALRTQRESETRLDLGKQAELDDEPGNNVFNQTLLGMLRRGVDEKAESFESFLGKKNPALIMLTDAVRGGFANLTGRKFVTKREELMDEWKIEEGRKLKEKELRDRNLQVAVQVANSQQNQRSEIAFRMKVEGLKSAHSEREFLENKRQFEAQYGLDTAKLYVDIDKELTRAREKELGSPIDEFEQANKEINRTKPGLLTKDPIKFNELSAARADEIIKIRMADELKLFSDKEAAKKRFKPSGNVSGDILKSASEAVLQGMSLIDAQRIVGRENMNALGAEMMGRVKQTPKYREQATQIFDNLNMISQLKGLVVEAQEQVGHLSEQEILENPDLRQNIKDRVNGWLAKIEGGIGLNPAASIIEKVSPFAARKMAKAAGEGARMSDQDAVQFMKALPGLADGRVDLAELERFNRRMNAQQLLEQTRNLGTFGRPPKEFAGAKPIDQFIKTWNAASNSAASEKEKEQSASLRSKLGTTNLVDAVVKAYELGIITDVVF